MEIVFVTVLFSLWFLLWVVYVFKRSWLGSLAISLNRLGWLSNWSMFVQTERFAGKQLTLFYRDGHEKDDVSDWKEVQYIKWHPLFALINPSVGLRSLMVACCRQLIQEHKNGNEQLNQLEAFDFLCHTVCQMQPKNGADTRQIRLIYAQSDSSGQVLVESHFIRLS